MQTGFQTENADQLPLVLVADAHDEFVEKMGDTALWKRA